MCLSLTCRKFGICTNKVYVFLLALPCIIGFLLIFEALRYSIGCVGGYEHDFFDITFISGLDAATLTHDASLSQGKLTEGHS